MPLSDQGVSTDRYMVIPRVLIFITRADHLLLIKGSPNKRLWANRYNGIGGHVEKGEDILEAARRELFEETGLAGVDLRLCGNIMVDASIEIGISIFLFLGESKNDDLVESEEGQLAWVPFSQVTALPLVEDLYTIIPRVLSFKIGDRPILGHTYYNEKDQLVIVI
jgi:8-oxo-dGTP diphosphatase